MQFSRMEDFTNWKEDLEIKSASSFVLQCAPKQRSDHVVYYYYCNRSGHYNPRGKGKRSTRFFKTGNLLLSIHQVAESLKQKSVTIIHMSHN